MCTVNIVHIIQLEAGILYLYLHKYMYFHDNNITHTSL